MEKRKEKRHLVASTPHKLRQCAAVGTKRKVGNDGHDALPPEYVKWLRNLYKSSYAFRDKMDTDGVNHYLRMFDLTEGLIRRGYGDADIQLILGGNFRRVLTQIWTTKA